MRPSLPLLACALLAACGPQSPSSSSPSPSPSPSPSASASPSPSPSPSASPAPDAASRRIEADVRFLADDLLEGREAGTRGYDLAAAYVATQYHAIGLEPAGADGWFQPVPMLRGTREQEGARFEIERDGKRTALAFETEWLPGTHYTRGAFELTAPMVFVGEAVHAPALGHDDFANVDVAGKIVVSVGKAPARFSNDERAYHASSLVKSAELEKRGAVGVIWLSDPVEEAKRGWELGARNWRRPGMRLVEGGTAVDDFPGLVARASVRASKADLLFEGSGHTAEEVFAALKDGKLTSFDLAGRATIAGRAKLESVVSRNVVAKLRGSDPALAGEHVVFTAHLDHVGLGAPVAGDAINNGALDNALGVAVMLEAARAFAAAPAPKRSIVFIALTAEEKGLLGAHWFARNPTVPKGAIVANVNMDMPILLAPQADVVPTGVEHSTLQAVLEQATREMGITLTPDPIPEEVVFVRSDQYAFVREGVPAVYLNGGIVATDGSDAKATMMQFLKSHYHLPSDDAKLSIHYPTAARLAALNRRIGQLVADAPERPRWNDGDFFGETFGKKRD